jgi:hypothetical protein
MSRAPYLIIAILVCSLILAAGCTGRNGTVAPAVPTPAFITLESLVLTPSEVPQNFTLHESRVKNTTEVGKLARDLGWQQGYIVRFIRPLEGIPGQTEILQTVTWYPAKNIPTIAALAEKQEQSDNTMIFTNLSSPPLGSYSQAFSGTANPRMTPEPDNGNLLGSGPVEGTVQQDFFEIIFSKGDILEVIRMTGPGADYVTLAGLAQKAYNKIP